MLSSVPAATTGSNLRRTLTTLGVALVAVAMFASLVPATDPAWASEPTASASATAKQKRAAKKRAAKRRAAKRRAHRESTRKPAAGTVKAVGQQTLGATGILGATGALTAKGQLAAMTIAINAAPAHFAPRVTGCAYTTPMLADQPGDILAGQFRGVGGCFVWINLSRAQDLSAAEICKTTLHEMGHLAGLEHSADPLDVMFSPFLSEPVPAPCSTVGARIARAASAVGVSAGSAVAASASVVRLCPPGAVVRDYCAAAPKARSHLRNRRATGKRRA